MNDRAEEEMMPDYDPLPDAQRAWQALDPQADWSSDAVRRIRRIQRHVAGERLAGSGLPLALLGLIAGALWHASNQVERLLGAIAAVGVVVAWGIYLTARRSERRALAATALDFLAAGVRRRRAERRLAAFVGVVVALELVFLIPWWMGGMVKHAGHLAAPVVIFTLWLPAASIAFLLLWSLRLWRQARTELSGLEAVATEFDEDR